jgi:hypothetical protein
MKPTVADSRTPNRLILRGPAGDLPPVTAEVAGSSAVVPAIDSKWVKGPSPHWKGEEHTMPVCQIGPQKLKFKPFTDAEIEELGKKRASSSTSSPRCLNIEIEA